MTDPTVPVARDLAAIARLAARLPEEAAHHADHPDLPGGPAMVLLGPVASPALHALRVDMALRAHYATCPKPGHRECDVPGDGGDEDPEDVWAASQLLRYWAEGLRRALDRETDWPTLADDAAFLARHLPWLHDHEPHWEHLVRDVATARTRLEALLGEGKADRRGVQCLSCGTTLVRTSRDREEPRECAGHAGVCAWPHRFCPHDRGGLADEWTCPGCDRAYSLEDYRRAVAHAHFAYAEWLPVHDCAERVGVRPGTIWSWASRGRVAKRQEAGRVVYCVEEARAAAREASQVAS